MKRNIILFAVLILLLAALVVLVPSASLLPTSFDALLPWRLNGALAEGGFAPLPVDDSAGPKPDPASYLPDNAGYSDPSITVTIETTREHGTDIMIARIRIVHPSQLRTSMAARYGSTALAPASSMAKRVNAVLAINGDYFSYSDQGYLVRNGKRFRKAVRRNLDMLVIDDRGDFHILTDGNPDEEADYTIIQSFNFGPALVIDGELGTRLNVGGMGGEKPTQRMGFGQMGPLSYIAVATEGPENKGSRGLTVEEFAQFMFELGCEQAYNLDGGSSSSLVLNNAKINALSTGKIRSLADIIYFATLIPGEVE
ncbi:MAG: phosphodiester glycosidase family protein [Oscillospiraceae bacterium]|jgi:exopolysaccharide biosynthesis protein|nr:phosphodiester glycosidase family protein [Oscillospiraceae bacterium]